MKEQRGRCGSRGDFHLRAQALSVLQECGGRSRDPAAAVSWASARCLVSAQPSLLSPQSSCSYACPRALASAPGRLTGQGSEPQLQAAQRGYGPAQSGRRAVPTCLLWTPHKTSAGPFLPKCHACCPFLSFPSGIHACCDHGCLVMAVRCPSWQWGHWRLQLERCPPTIWKGMACGFCSPGSAGLGSAPGPRLAVPFTRTRGV